LNETAPQDCTAPLSALVAISMQMLASAQLEDWERVRAAEDERRELLDTLFRTPPRDDQAELWTATLRRVLDINAQVIAVIRERRRDTASVLGAVRRGQRSQAEYAKYTDGV